MKSSYYFALIAIGVLLVQFTSAAPSVKVVYRKIDFGLLKNSYSLSDSCNLEKDRGPCHGVFLKFYYDKNSNTCQTFIYGGCQGNSNNFKSAQECEKACRSA